MTKFWDKVLEMILSRGQRERHEKYLWDKQCGLTPTTSISSTSSLDRAITPEFKPTFRPTGPITGKVPASPQTPKTGSPTIYSPSTTPLVPHSPVNSAPESPTYSNYQSKMTSPLVPRAPLPRRPREDRPYFSLEPLIEAQKLAEKPWGNALELPPPKLPLPKQDKGYLRQPLLYEVPPLSQTQGVGRYRLSVNATEEFIDSTINKRNDSFADLLAMVTEKPRAQSGEWIKPARVTGNMDTTSPPPPRKAFSRGNSPVRLAIYGDGVDEVAEEELEERDGKLIFGRRKISTVRVNDGDSRKGGCEKTLMTTSDPGVMTTEAVVTAVTEEKQVASAKKRQGRDEEAGRGRRKTFDGRPANRKLKGDLAPRIRHVITSQEVEEAVETDCEDVEEVESFSDQRGEKLMKAAIGNGSKEKERVGRTYENARKGRRQLKGSGQAGAGTGVVLKAGGQRKAALRK
ncbi:hypothetical protein BDZ91DRAFT_271502 [Kalaharituber pfeilii]|nr:hypothetical protein BDZ91DRAFT_271502 [Kalaharituber pfeilii]